jgi:hypothetical protein
VLICFIATSCSKRIIGAHKTGWKQNDFLISYCCSAPPIEQSMINAKNENFNLVPAWIEALDFAEKHGIKVMLEHGLLHPETAYSKEKLEQLDELIDKVKDHPALGAYYVYDEPQPTHFHAVAALVDRIRKRDPNHLSFVNMLPIYAVEGKRGTDPGRTYLDFLCQYIETVKPDLLSYDYYNFFQKDDGKPYDLENYFVNISIVREAALKGNIPFLNIIQASKFLPNFREPNQAELRWQVYTTLAYGGRGISYFLYWGPKSYMGIYRDGKPTESLLTPIVQLNKELKSLGPELMKLKSTSIFHTSPIPTGGTAIPSSEPVSIESKGELVLGLFDSEIGKAFMVVNRDYHSNQLLTFKVKNKSEIERFDRDDSSWKKLRSDNLGCFNIDLKAGDGQLFRY